MLVQYSQPFDEPLLLGMLGEVDGLELVLLIFAHANIRRFWTQDKPGPPAGALAALQRPQHRICFQDSQRLGKVCADMQLPPCAGCRGGLIGAGEFADLHRAAGFEIGVAGEERLGVGEVFGGYPDEAG